MPLPAALLVTVALGYGATLLPRVGPAEPTDGPVATSPAAAPPPPAMASVASPGPSPDAGEPLPGVAATPSTVPSPRAQPAPFPSPSPGRSLPGAILPAHRLVAYYGNPLAREMGILGAAPSDEMLARLLRQVEAHTAADPAHPAQPALELVTPAAQAAPGSDGLYRARMPTEVIDKVAGWAESSNALLILDVQVGRSSLADEVAVLEPWLKRPYVHLALDPEFAMATDEVPGKVVGSMDAASINRTIGTLSRLVSEGGLPPKVLIVHRFTEDMVVGYRDIRTTPEVQVVMTMDGFGAPELKTAQYERYVRDQPVQFAGIKLFYTQDKPLMSPADVLGLEPAPDVIIYQ